jgi:hypothetical protein
MKQKKSQRLKDVSHFAREASAMDATASDTRVKANKNILQ